MAIELTINGQLFEYPEQGDQNWGPDATDWAVAVTSGMLQKAGGLFQLLSEADFGSGYGLKSIYYKSRSSNVADAGQLRLARTDVINFRNQANSANLSLGVNSSDILTFNGTAIQNGLTVSDTATIDLTFSADTLSADIKSDSITNAMINSAAGIVYSKLSLSNSIVNADVNSAAAIAYSKLNLSASIVNADIATGAAIARSKIAVGTPNTLVYNLNGTGELADLSPITGNRAIVSTASGLPTASATTDTEIGYVSGVTSAIQTQLNAKLNLAGGTMSGALTLAADPVNPLEAATKQYVDNVAQGLSAKQAALVATTTNITLSGEQTIDGVLTSGSRVLVKNQSSSAENGIYVSAAGAWSRSSDANTWAELVSAYVFVSQGTTQADTGWLCTVDPGGTIGVTAVTFVQFSSAGLILAGAGLVKTGNTLDVQVDNSSIEISTNQLRVKALGITAAMIANTTITNAQISASAAIAYSKLALSASIVNADINASAAITLTKLATMTASRAVVSDGSGFLVPSTTTATEIGYVNGVTSSIQTQINTKMVNPMTLGGQLIYGGASGTPTALNNGSAGQILQSNGTTLAPTWVTPAGGYTVTAVSTNITLASSSIFLVSTASARSLQLPSPSSTFICYIKDATGNAQTNNITLVRAGSEQIEGVAANKILQTNWGSWMLVSDGTNWFLL